ncbi:MAG TPA: hypothetical protein VMU43_09400 [Candidatus Acidoferrum sp.]|nr:hypothetical protein [Candidatus Acidoferrum sp.]
MSLNGRVEPRVALPILVYLIDPSGSEAAELVRTQNVCIRGVRLLSRHHRSPGEQKEITPLGSGLHLRAQIVYCQRVSSSTYSVGLRIQDERPDWWKAE